LGPLGPVAAAVLAVLAQIGYPLVHGRARADLTVATVVVFCAASAGHALATRGRRAGAALLATFAAGGWLVDAVGVATGVPFGRYGYSGRLGPAALGVPLVVGPAWCMMAWPAYLAAARLLRTSRPAGRLRRPARVLLAGVALAGWDLFLDPQMVGEGYWTWQRPNPALPGVPGVPLSNYAGWLLVAVLLMAAFEALAGRATARPGPDAVPMALYLWTYGSSTLAHTAFFGRPGSAAWGALGMGLVALPLAATLRR
jgi:putative membrane protein